MLLRNSQKHNYTTLFMGVLVGRVCTGFFGGKHLISFLNSCSPAFCQWYQGIVRIIYQEIIFMYASLLTKQHKIHLEINIHQRTLDNGTKKETYSSHSVLHWEGVQDIMK